MIFCILSYLIIGGLIVYVAQVSDFWINLVTILFWPVILLIYFALWITW